MPARVLIVDDDPTALAALEMRLSEEYFEVSTAGDGEQGLEQMKADPPDIVLLDVVMPGINGYEVCERMRSDPELLHVPIVMLSVKSEPEDVVQGLKAGADDYLEKLFDDLVVLARIRSLVRSKLMMDEFRRREQTSNQLGVLDSEEDLIDSDVLGRRILVIDDDAETVGRIPMALASSYQVTSERDPDRAMAVARDGEFDLIVVSLTMDGSDGLRLCSHLRTMEETRQTAILVITEPDSSEMLVRALEIGVSDYLKVPVNTDEMMARVRTQIKRKMYQDRLRANYETSLALAVTDSLTSLHNRRYMVSHLETLMERGRESGRPVALLIMDIDHFKNVNDNYGHAVGDEVLQEFAERIKRNVRGIDLAVRYGGEEFVVVLPGTDPEVAKMVAERLRQNVAEEPFEVSADVGTITVTVSIGVTVYDGTEVSTDGLLRRADEALYTAKNQGRNQVVTV
ncbi:MAG: PleD family two-component system response regulator [Alphaproteobacteria bacterium]|nr:PleD family two-component system response regulator [Alphaproteobacteria bacterium]|tara:strand:- start:375 stop:1742 length:1368 start_codon:yes stop_codon:yes gene_type:complete